MNRDSSCQLAPASSWRCRLLAACLALLVAIAYVASSPPARVHAAGFAAAKQRLYPANLPSQVAHPGSLLVAFRTPVVARNNRFEHDSRGSASDQQLAAVNQALTGIGAIGIDHLFTNVPAATLDAARAKTEAATHAFVTDFTQVYQVRFNPAINSGVAANRMTGSSSLISSAMPNFVMQPPSRGEAQALSPAAVQQALAAPRAAGVSPGAVSASGLPTNSGYQSDAQSYHDAASNDVTGAGAMIASRFHQQPGQGEVVTNISLGTVDDTSTVLDHGQRYIEEAGLPKIPVWLSSQNCTTNADGTQTCSVVLDPTATNTADGQGDFLEVNLDFSVMAPPPLGDPRIVNPAPAGRGEILGEAYGASYRLINPLVNNTPNFFAAFLGAALLQSPAPAVITASIGNGFGIGGFSDYFFEQEAMIHDVVSTVVNGADVFVTISAGDGQTATQVAMNPDGLTGRTDVTTDPIQLTDINDPFIWTNPNYSYGLTDEPQFVIDSGANDAGGDTLNDVYNNAPWNTAISSQARHSQHTTETRWTGQQNYHSGNGSRVNLSAPGDDVLMLAQIEQNGVPINPVATFPRLIGGTSASSPEIAGAAAVVRQAARLLGRSLSARQVRDLLVATARPNLVPAFDLSNANVGPNLDLTRAVQTLFDQARVGGTPQFVRMTLAERKAVLTPTDLRSSFWSDTTQDPMAHTATIDLSQGLVAPSSRTNETVGSSGDNVFAPITFGVDSAFLPASQARYQWSLTLGGQTVAVPGGLFDQRLPFIRLLPSEIFGLLGASVTSASDRVVTVTARSGPASIATNVTFTGQTDATHGHAIPPSFDPVFRPNRPGDTVRFAFDLRGVRDGAGGQVDGGILLVSDIDRAVPQAFPDQNLDAHGFKVTLPGLVGTIDLPASDFPHGVGTYGVAVRGTKGGREVADSTSFWSPLRYASTRGEQLPQTPKIQAQASLFNGTAPLFWEVADTEPDVGSTQLAVTFDVRAIRGARGALIEFSAPTSNFFSGVFFTGNLPDPFVNNFTNINGDRLDTGDNFGQRGSAAHVQVRGTNGLAVLDGAAVGLSVPATGCDNTYGMRVFATDGSGRIIGVASDPSLLSYTDFSRAACRS
jgi:Subtilase family